MIQAGRSLRLGRLLKGEHAPLFLVPMDHTVTDGPFADAHRYRELVGVLADNGADAIIVHKGRLQLLDRAVYAKLRVVVHISASTRYHDPNEKYQIGDAEDCLRRGADAISVHVNLGSQTEKQQIRMLADTADACDRAGLPLIAMIYPRGPGVKDRPWLETVLHAASLAADLGADIVKLPLGGAAALDMKQVVDSCPIPVVSAGGSQVSDGEFNQFVAQVMQSGARGIAAGRNIFLAADPAAKVRDVRRVLEASVGAAPGARPIDPARLAPDSARIGLDGGNPGLELRA